MEKPKQRMTITCQKGKEAQRKCIPACFRHLTRECRHQSEVSFPMVESANFEREFSEAFEEEKDPSAGASHDRTSRSPRKNARRKLKKTNKNKGKSLREIFGKKTRQSKKNVQESSR